MSKKFNLTTQYYTSADPDYDKLRVWIVGRSLGNNMRDYSGYERTITLNGDPILVDGAPFDWGLADTGSPSKSIALRFNRPTSDLVNQEGVYISSNALIRSSEALVTGISFFFRLRVFDTAKEGGEKRTLMRKVDVAGSSNYGTHIFIDDINKRICWFQKTGGTVFKKETAANTILAGNVYDVWLTYAVSGNVQNIYINNSLQTLSTSGYGEFWGDLSDTDVNIFHRDGGTGCHVYGDLYDFRIYREKIISATEIGRHWTNKITIANIPFGQVNVTNYGCTSP
jgi:hypothetical protein